MLPNPFITLSTQIIAAVTTPTAAALMPEMICMALYCFFANKYRHAIFSSVFMLTFPLSLRYHSESF